MLLYFLLHREDQLVLPVPSIMTGIDRKQKGFPDGSVVKNLPANAREAGSIPGSGRWPPPPLPPEKEMAIHSSILAWEIPWSGEPGGLQSIGSQKSWI